MRNPFTHGVYPSGKQVALIQIDLGTTPFGAAPRIIPKVLDGSGLAMIGAADATG